MIDDIALILTLLCFAFLVVCGILHKIEISWAMKGLLCIGMLSIIGFLTKSFHIYDDEMFDILTLVCSLIIFKWTRSAYKRGFL
jgi:hypothetical protein